MSDEKLKDGDTVRLKSGGPLMTVSGEGDETSVWCVWFVGEEKRADTFTRLSLKHDAPK
jgi:uncharacterized protein YodC (DUF2158 family)